MLDPNVLDSLPDALVALYAQAEQDILADMARRLAQYDYWIPAAEHQRQKLREMNVTQQEIIKQLSQLTGKSKDEIKQLMQQACDDALETDREYYRQHGTDVPAALSQEMKNILNAGYTSTGKLFKNLTKTTASAGQTQFVHALDRAWLEVQSGAFDYSTAIRSAVKELSRQGLHAVQYPSGRSDTLEVAVRRSIVTGINQTAAQMELQLADELDSDLVETTAHAGARPSHVVWQGQVFSLSGKNPKYPDFRSATGYGTGAGLCGWNCRHSFFPYFEGAGHAYTSDQLRSYEDKSISYNGKMYTEYEVSQMQRHNERQIRRWKREYAAMEAAGLDTTEAAVKLHSWRERQRDFLEQTGLKVQSARRETVGFGRSQARKAGTTAKKQADMIENFSQKMQEKGYAVKGFDRYYGDQETLSHMLSAFERMATVYPQVAEGLTIAYSYSKDSDTVGWYNPKTNTIGYNKQTIGNWNYHCEEYEKLVKEGWFPQGTTPGGAFYHEFGHAYAYANNMTGYKKKIDKVLKDMGYGYVNVQQRKNTLRKELSQYSTAYTNPTYQEVVAESFSEWYTSDNPRRFCTAFMREAGAV